MSSTTRGAQVGIEFVIGRRNGNQDLDEEGSGIRLLLVRLRLVRGSRTAAALAHLSQA